MKTLVYIFTAVCLFSMAHRTEANPGLLTGSDFQFGGLFRSGSTGSAQGILSGYHPPFAGKTTKVPTQASFSETFVLLCSPKTS